MDFRSLDDLRQVDELTLRFTSMGFHTGGMLTPEAAAQYQQEVVSRAELAEEVAEGTRATFDRLRLLHSYGVLSYEMFTAADDLANLVIEQALRDRFVEFNGGTVQFEDARGEVHDVPAASFDVLYEEIHAEGRLRRPKRWRLRLSTGELLNFDGMLDSLRWARREGLLRGQRNRKLEPVLKKIRNSVAHGGGHHLVTPVESARTISDAAEIINHLWGFSTPGGRLYPAPIRRTVQVVAWSANADFRTGGSGQPLAASLRQRNASDVQECMSMAGCRPVTRGAVSLLRDLIAFVVEPLLLRRACYGWQIVTAFRHGTCDRGCFPDMTSDCGPGFRKAIIEAVAGRSQQRLQAAPYRPD